MPHCALAYRESDVPTQPASVEAVIHLTRLTYVTDQERRTLEHHWKATAKHAIGWSAFRRRAALGGWVEQRQRYWARVGDQVIAERAGEMARAHIAELDQLVGIRARVVQALGSTKPRSLEGVVSALVRLDEHVDAKGQAALERFQPLLTARTASAGPAGTFTSEEYRAMATALLRHRMSERRMDEERMLHATDP